MKPVASYTILPLFLQRQATEKRQLIIWMDNSSVVAVFTSKKWNHACHCLNICTFQPILGKYTEVIFCLFLHGLQFRDFHSSYKLPLKESTIIPQTSNDRKSFSCIRTLILWDSFSKQQCQHHCNFREIYSI